MASKLKEASFTRTDAPDGGATFSIIPAARPPFLRNLTWITGILAVFSVLGGPFSIIIMIIPLLLCGFMLLRLRVKTKDSAPRKPVVLIVNSKGITVEGKHYSAADIRELVLDHPRSRGAYMTETTTLIYGQVSAHAASSAHARQTGRRMGRELINSSLALMLRLRSSSEREIAAFGLTQNVGESLLADVKAELWP